MTCEKCGAELRIGSFPFCKGGHGPWTVNVIDDELPNGPYLCETLGHEPVYVTSKSHLRREAEARGLECVGGRKSDAYFAQQRRLLDEKRRDLKLPKNAPVSL